MTVACQPFPLHRITHHSTYIISGTWFLEPSASFLARIYILVILATHSRRRSVHLFRRPIGSRNGLLLLMIRTLTHHSTSITSQHRCNITSHHRITHHRTNATCHEHGTCHIINVARVTLHSPPKDMMNPDLSVQQCYHVSLHCN
jgi:hypothetical protein